MQASLFAAEAPVDTATGLRFVPEMLSHQEEQAWLALVRRLDFADARYKQYTARRRVAAFGERFDYDTHRLEPAPGIPPAFLPLRDRVAAWLGVDPESFAHMLISEYRPGTPLGWHRDVPDFESIVGLSLLGAGRMRFRRYPPVAGQRAGIRQLDLPPRSAYVIEGEMRWGWQHSIVPTAELRYSVTLRTRRGAPLLLAGAEAQADVLSTKSNASV